MSRPAAAGPPKGPGGLPASAWRTALTRTVKAFKAANLGDLAAGLTYYAVLAIAPALLALVSVLGLIGRPAIDALKDNVATLAPGSARDVLTTLLDELGSRRGQAGVALVIGVALALWSASGYVAAFMRASNTVYRMPEGRPVWKTLPVRVGVTAVLVLLVALMSVGVVFTGALARRAGQVLGLGDTAVTVWNIAKWPVLAILAVLAVAILYRFAPNVRHGWRWVTPGSLFAVLVWAVASVAFAVYVANFGSYNKTYGSLATVVIFLVWLWISNIALLLGLAYDAELERARAEQAGHPPDEEPHTEPRDTRGFS
ncbi:YihY/virulence factor BrkB family protein [Streptomyces sp. RFCAC02]|uniref:YihY/virulence factor BrkB family protein n=1 Tax=Streptomyces sp. RFCAC02 TaxID=2499143 RepID=UPI001F0F6964|nr:YihY/virulence factor BrkB family protein [Streptomyces sp. RFCAC02]